MSNVKNQSEYPSPKQFLKSRRPKQFSDTIESQGSSIDMAQLEFYFSTLANRSQEKEFEHFAKRLCELIICPNLQPNTGPSGGGDGKVDSQTYPVSSTTQLGWYIGVGDKALKERWAFAFSIKKDWVAKVKSDVKEIDSTKRDYKVIYFVTSQYTPSKKRSDIEDELSKLYSVTVKILDGTWLLEETFKNNYQQVAIDELNIQTSEQKLTDKGILDAKRSQSLKDCEKKIKEDISKDAITKNTVDLSIRAGILSRQLELPRHETDGRFVRAARLAADVGNEFSRFEATYQHAWTTFWWFEDFKSFKALFLATEKEVINTDNIYNFEKLVSLWNLLAVVRDRDKKLIPKSFFDQHTEKLKNKLTEISEDTSRLAAPLYAKSLLLQIELREKAIGGDDLGPTLVDIEQIVKESQDLVGFPLRPLIDILTELSDFLDDYPEYEQLFDTAVEIVSKRDGELAAADLALARARKQLQAGKNYEAIKSLGGVLRNLHKYESKDDAIRALYMMGIAYKNVGLYWAARGSFLSAGSLATNDLWNHGEVTVEQQACYEELKRLELRLGRLPHLLEWNRTDLYARQVLISLGESEEQFKETAMVFDLMLGIVFLRMNAKELEKHQYLPDVLLNNGLEYSSMALLHALGHNEELPEGMSQEENDEYFKRWAAEYSGSHLPTVLDAFEEDKVHLSSNILGCTVDILTNKQENCMELAESILAATESMLATSTLHRAAAKEQSAQLDIVFSSQQREMVTHIAEDDKGYPVIHVVCGKFNPHKLTSKEQSEMADNILKVVADLLVRIIMFSDFKKEMGIILEEGAMDRALNFTSTFVRLGNILGYKPMHTMNAWTDGKEKYTLNQPDDYQGIVVEAERSQPILKKKPENSHDLRSHIKHTDIKTVTVIRDQLWDEAKWEGAGFAGYLEQPPIFMFLFKNIEAGKNIFKAWRERFGKVDEKDELRITIVRGIEKKNPYYYRIGVGANIEKDASSTGLVSTMVRMNTMTPTNSVNLDNFLDDYTKYGCYWLVPAVFGPDGKLTMEFDLAILKEKVILRDAWEVSLNTLDSTLIRGDDDPIIPEDQQETAPVLDLLKLRREQSDD